MNNENEDSKQTQQTQGNGRRVQGSGSNVGPRNKLAHTKQNQKQQPNPRVHVKPSDRANQNADKNKAQVSRPPIVKETVEKATQSGSNKDKEDKLKSEAQMLHIMRRMQKEILEKVAPGVPVDLYA